MADVPVFVTVIPTWPPPLQEEERVEETVAWQPEVPVEVEPDVDVACVEVEVEVDAVVAWVEVEVEVDAVVAWVDVLVEVEVAAVEDEVAWVLVAVEVAEPEQ